MYSIAVVAVSREGLTDFVMMTEEYNMHLTVEFAPNGDTPTDIERIVLFGNFGENKNINVQFDKRCVPDNPFYVRWVNALGGFEYAMFDQYKAYESAAAGIVDFFPSFSSTTAATRTREFLNLEDAKRTVTVGLEQLDRDEYDRLAGIMFSPRIDVWNRELERWEGITLDGNTKAAWGTHGTKGMVEYRFRLKDVQLQY